MLAAAQVAQGRAGQGRRQPVRTCAGCRRAVDASSLCRLSFVAEPSPQLVADDKGQLGGRGVWVHPDPACLQRACKGGFARSLKRSVPAEPGQIAAALRLRAAQRAYGLLSAALRRREAAVGTDAVRGALESAAGAGADVLLVVAKDAAGRRGELVGRAEQLGVRWVELGDKARLGELAGRATVGLLAVTNKQIAEELLDMAGRLEALEVLAGEPGEGSRRLASGQNGRSGTTRPGPQGGSGSRNARAEDG